MFEEDTEFDAIYFNGEIEAKTAHDLFRLISSKQSKAEKIRFYVSTPGGDPKIAYSIMRFLRNKYTTIFFYVTGSCKSAGTLMALGADRIIFTPLAELGPLDIQVRKKDELSERMSTTVISSALSELNNQVADTVKYLTYRIHFFTGMSTRSSIRIASNIVQGLYAPVFSKIDPIHIGENSRQLRISEEYGKRIKTANVKEGTLKKLIYDYPSHDFAIDYFEAKDLFNYVDAADALELELFNLVIKSKETNTAIDLLDVKEKADDENRRE